MPHSALRPLREALAHEADEAQREFNQLGEQLKAVSRRFFEYGVDPAALQAQQTQLRQQQTQLAAEINRLREWTRSVTQLYHESEVRDFLQGMQASDVERIRSAVALSLAELDGAPVEPSLVAAVPAVPRTGMLDPAGQTPAHRLLDRARTESTLRTADPAGRERAAAEFAGRPGLGSDEAALEQITGALTDPDPWVQETATLTLIQLYRFRALRSGDQARAEQAVQWLTRAEHPAVVAVLGEVLGKTRGGYSQTAQLTNRRFRLMALERLVAWHTRAAQAVLRAQVLDRDGYIAQTARRALTDFPGDWPG